MFGRSLRSFPQLQFDFSDRFIESGQVIKGGSFGPEQWTSTMRGDDDGVPTFSETRIAFMDYFNFYSVNFYVQSLQ